MSKLPPVDKDGYVTVTLGMFDKNIPEDVFENFRKRCLAGEVRSALGNPRVMPGEPSETWFKRVMSIDEASVCAQILDVEMSEDGKRMVGKVVPAGPHGKMLRELLDGDSNVTFGMRSFHDTRDKEQKRPVHITTYDLILPE